MLIAVGTVVLGVLFVNTALNGITLTKLFRRQFSFFLLSISKFGATQTRY